MIVTTTTTPRQPKKQQKWFSASNMVMYLLFIITVSTFIRFCLGVYVGEDEGARKENFVISQTIVPFGKSALIQTSLTNVTCYESDFGITVQLLNVAFLIAILFRLTKHYELAKRQMRAVPYEEIIASESKLEQPIYTV